VCGQQGPPDGLYTELHQLFRSSEVSVDRRGLTTVVSIPGSHLFRPDGLSLRDEAMMTLDLLSTALNLHPDHRVQLEGHTDAREPTGPFAQRFTTAWDLSHARAAAVMDSLTGRFRVAESRFTLVARGPNEPVATN